jgi:hypothetical protein
MAKLVLGFPNWVAGTTIATPSIDAAGSWLSALPAINVLEAPLAKVARSSDATPPSTQLRIDLGTERHVQVVAIPKSNVSTAGRIRATGYSDSGYSVEVVTTGWVDYWADAYEFGSRVWGAYGLFTPKFTPEDAAGYPPSWSYVLPTLEVARYWQIEIDDTANADGYVELSRVVLAPGWQASENPTIGGTTIGWESRSRVLRSRAGVAHVDVLPTQRLAVCSFTAIPEGETFANPFEMARRLGLEGEIFLITDPDDTTHAIRRAFLARLRSMPVFAYGEADRLDFTVELEEIL